MEYFPDARPLDPNESVVARLQLRTCHAELVMRLGFNASNPAKENTMYRCRVRNSGGYFATAYTKDKVDAIWELLLWIAKTA